MMTRSSVKLAIFGVFIASASFLAPYQYAAEANKCNNQHKHMQPNHKPKPEHDHRAPPLPLTPAPAPGVTNVEAPTTVPTPPPALELAPEVKAQGPTIETATPTGETLAPAPAPALVGETPTPAPAPPPAPWYPYWREIFGPGPHGCGHLCLTLDDCDWPCTSCCDFDMRTLVGKCCELGLEEPPEQAPLP